MPMHDAAGTVIGESLRSVRTQSREAPAAHAPLPTELPARVERPRLEQVVSVSSAVPITVLHGGAGFGKSDLLQTFQTDPQAIFFRAGSEHASFARFVHGLARSVSPVAPGAPASFPRAWERALQSRSPSGVLAHWLCEHLANSAAPLAIDDLHTAAADPGIAAFIEKLAELRPDAALTLALRDTGALPIALWMATGRMERPIDESALRFDAAEVAAAAHGIGVPLSDAAIGNVLAATGGLPVAVVYALTRLRRDSQAFACRRMPSRFNDIAAMMFECRSSQARELLFIAALCPRFDDELLRLCGCPDGSKTVGASNEDAPFMWGPDGAGGLRFHDRFRAYVLERFAAYDPHYCRTIAKAAIGALRVAGRHADALDIATRQGLADVMGDLLDEHGNDILESGRVDVIGEALDAVALRERAVGARVFALRGYLDARRGRLDIAEAWFRLGLEHAADETTRVTIALSYARELTLRRREDASEVLAPFAASTTLPRSLLIDVRSSVAQGLAAANQLEEARCMTDDVLSRVDEDDSTALRARVFARAAYVANECGSYALARERALIAAPLAVAEALYEVAVSAYSVLYAIAYADDDAVLSREYLRCVRDMGAKSGTLRFELYALLGLYELSAEAGDVPALAVLERQLAAIDKHDAGVEIIEALLPAKALQAGWTGDFRAAAEFVRPTAEQYATPERRALSWAQISLFSAAQGDVLDARAAVDTARETLAQVEVPTSLTGQTLLTFALAAWAGGDLAAACHWLCAADASMTGRIPRLRALRAALCALIDGSLRTDGLGANVALAFAQLRAASFGGWARIISALPCPQTQTDARRRSVGGVLANRDVAAHLDDALTRGHAGALREWLDALPDPVTRELSASSAFDRWAARQPKDLRLRATIAALRREFELSAQRTPAFVKLVDVVDASIAKLFEHLDAASPLTAEHSRAVSAWCSRLARMLGLPEEQIRYLSRCGLIHDIGKMMTPADILNAPRRLNPGEWSIMREHAAQGSRIVADVLELRPFMPVVRGHHERLDGKGYPDGLRLSAIPFAARIVAVTDSFNAMIARRPYRVPLEPNAALNELQTYAGTQFDPEIVAAMIRVVAGYVA
jgi:putative nucleotidyltransferase with HDIG domain